MQITLCSRHYSATVAAMLVAALGDVAMTIISYAATALATLNISWIYRRWPAVHWIMIEATAVFQSIIVEKFGLYMNRWSYTSLAPILPIVAVSLLPVLQLALLFPATFAIAPILDRRWHRNSRSHAKSY